MKEQKTVTDDMPKNPPVYTEVDLEWDFAIAQNNPFPFLSDGNPVNEKKDILSTLYESNLIPYESFESLMLKYLPIEEPPKRKVDRFTDFLKDNIEL